MLDRCQLLQQVPCSVEVASHLSPGHQGGIQLQDERIEVHRSLEVFDLLRRLGHERERCERVRRPLEHLRH